MAKNKPQKIEPWHNENWCFENLSAEQITDGFRLLLNEDKYKKLFDSRVRVRNQIIQMDNTGRYIPSHMLFAFNNLVAIDKQISEYMLSYLVEYERRTTEQSLMTIDDMKSLYSTEEAQNILAKILSKVKFLMVLSNMAETLTLDINSLVKKVDKNAVFGGAEGLMAGLRQIRAVLNKDCQTKTQEVKDLWIDLYDSIEANATKRIKAAYKREQKILDRNFKEMNKKKSKQEDRQNNK